MSTTDDTLLRDLAERADRAVPPMALDADAVLAGGRRFRRRRAVLRSAAGLAGAGAVALAAVGVVGQLGDLRDDGVPVAAQLVTVGDFGVIAATDVVPVEVGGTTVYDTGVPVDPADPDGARWVLEHVVLTQADLPDDISLDDVVSDYLAAREYDPATAALGEVVVGASAQRSDDWWGSEVDPMGGEFDDTLLAFGLAGVGYTPHLYLTGPRADVPAESSRVLVPTFEVPGVDGLVYFVRVAGDKPWPYTTLYPADRVSIQLGGSRPGYPWGR